MSPSSAEPAEGHFDCVVIGAGIAGVCAALNIQSHGATVTILDPGDPGSGASFGNAGIVVNTKLAPVFAGLTPGKLISMLRNPASPLNIRWSRLPALSPWFLRMLRHAGPGEVERITRALATLCQPGAGLYEPLWDEAELGDLVQARGSIALNRSAEEMERDWENTRFQRSLGAPMEKVGRHEIAEVAPTVSEDYTHGIYSPDFQHTLDPQDFVTRLFDLFRRKGGRYIPEAVQQIETTGGKATAVRTAGYRIGCGSIVVAAGTGSARLARQLGEGVPHQAVGGYHAVLTDPKVELRTPILPMDFRFAITPMSKGIRLAGTYEFGGEHLPFNTRLLDSMLRHIGQVLPGISTGQKTVWHGFRSYLPDGLPVVSRSSRHEGLFYVFGLSSAGMINGASVGRLVAQLWAGQTPDADVRPFAIQRFL